MATSGMRYKKTKVLVDLINRKKAEMDETLRTLSEDRLKEVASVYGGEAAENFEANVKKVSDYINGQIDEVISKLTNEAETQHDAYLAQEQRLKSQVQMER